MDPYVIIVRGTTSEEFWFPRLDLHNERTLNVPELCIGYTRKGICSLSPRRLFVPCPREGHL